MLHVKYFVRRYWPDLAALLVAIGVAWVGYRFASTPWLQFIGAVIVTLVATIVIVALRVRESAFHFQALDRPSDKNAWVGYGTFEYARTDRCFRITQSQAGFLFARTLNWSDYRLSFEFKVLHSCLGVLVRATNLANLLMLQLTQQGVRPHFRINGVWRPFEIAATGLGFRETLKVGAWYHGSIACDKDVVRIRINEGRREVADLSWSIVPAELHFVIATDDEGTPTNTVPVPAAFEYGTIGFRNDGAETALVRNVLLERLRG